MWPKHPSLQRILHLLPALLLLGSLGAPSPATAGAGAAVLSLPTLVPVVAGDLIDMPITLSTGGASIASMQFGFDMGPCLTYRPTPGLTFSVPAGFTTQRSYDASQATSELKGLLYTAGTVRMPDGVMASIPLVVTCSGPVGGSETVVLPFATTFPLKVFDGNNALLPSQSTNGSVLLTGPTPTNTPTGTRTPTETPTATPIPTDTPTGTRTPTPIPTATDTPSPAGTPVPTLPPPRLTPTFTPTTVLPPTGPPPATPGAQNPKVFLPIARR